MKEPTAASFTGLVDLAAASLGGRALLASDEFFAEKENLLRPGRGIFIEDKFTERGKWMDGWESRRKRQGSGGDGHDWCIVELGAAGRVLGFDIDTNHFSGNHPPFASVDGAVAPRGISASDLPNLAWRELLAQAPVRPSAQNLFSAEEAPPCTHLRLNIFPDGGVARFRAFGRVTPSLDPADWEWDEPTRAHFSGCAEPERLIDLAAVKNGGRALCCSDAHFGPMNNLLLPGRADNMGGGWETRRNRGEGHDWIIVELAARGVIAALEVDTNHFKGNYPERCSIDVIDAPVSRMTDLVRSRAWAPLLDPVALSAHTRHFFREPAVRTHAPATHVRLNIFPDGGLSRLRVWGRPLA